MLQNPSVNVTKSVTPATQNPARAAGIEAGRVKSQCRCIWGFHVYLGFSPFLLGPSLCLEQCFGTMISIASSAWINPKWYHWSRKRCSEMVALEQASSLFLLCRAVSVTVQEGQFISRRCILRGSCDIVSMLLHYCYISILGLKATLTKIEPKMNTFWAKRDKLG